jgi:2',3'-cyclic-nucleotide 2'-phosphodiesterase (5'-nucleotidase family)
VNDVTIEEPQVVQRAGALCDAGADASPCACGGASPCAAGFHCSDASLLCEKQIVTTSSPEAGAILDAAATALQARQDTQIGTVTGPFSYGGEDTHETALGDLVADALLAQYKWTQAKIALLEASSLRTGFPSPYASAAVPQRTDGGPLYYGDAYTALPLTAAAVVRMISGHTLHLVLERSLSRQPDPGFLQVAGIKLTYSTNPDAGSRIKTLALDDGTPIPDDATMMYNVVLTDGLSAGDGGYPMLAEGPSGATPARDLLVDIIANYVKSKGTLTPPAMLQRIVNVP